MFKNSDNNSKKLKLNNYSDFLNNEDDIDIDALDECFERATQTLNAEKEKLGETSFLQSYNAFRPPQFTSTQINNANEDNLAQKLKDFEKKYAEKEGEVSILRSNFEQLKATHLQQSFKDIEEWKEKFNLVQNRYEEVKTKLEFKNFENGNLKQKLRNLNSLKSSTAETQVTNKSNKISINCLEFYPLKNVDFSFVFELPNVTHCELWRNDAEQELMNKLKTVKTVFIDQQRELNVDVIYSEINFFIKCSKEEINSDLAIEPMTKIICVLLQFMKELDNYLEIIEEHMQPSQIQEVDIVHYQQEQSSSIDNVYFLGDSCIKEKELQCSKIITFLSKLLPINHYLNKFIFKIQTLLIEKKACNNIKHLPILQQKDSWNFLEMLLRIVSKIGKLRKTLICTTLLESIVQFLSQAYESEHVNNSINILNEITFEILFSRPDIKVVVQMVKLISVACQHTSFQEIFFRNCANESYLYFTRETCPFYMFNALVKNMLFKLKDDELFSYGCNNFVNFIYNIFKSKALLFSKTDGRYKCVLDLYRVYILVISKSLNRFIVTEGEIKHRIFFKKNLQLLSLWKFNYRELVQQSCQFKGVINRLRTMASQLEFTEFELAELEQLVPEVIQPHAKIDYSQCSEISY